MQIHEITQKKSNQLDEALGSGLGGAVGKTVSGIKNVGSAIASPFTNIAQGYKQGRADQTISMLSDKAYRAWQNYSVQWAKSQGGQYTEPGKGGASAAQSAGQTQGQTQSQTATGTQMKAKSSATNMDTLYATIQSLDNTKLNAIAKILSQRVGPAATMNALKTPESPAPVTESQLDELSWKDIQRGATAVKTGAQNFTKGLARTGDKIAGAATAVGGAAKELGYQAIGRPASAAYQAVKPGLAAAGQLAKQGIQQAPALAKAVGKEYSKAATKVGQAVKAAPGAVATAAGATAGAIAGMPARAQTAYRTGKQFATGPQMTTGELQQAIFKLTQAQATKLYSFVQQLQTARKAGLKEGISPATLIPNYKQALKAFVQKNLLSGMQYSRLQNAQQIDDLIEKIVDPANDSASAQKDLWNKLTLAASVSQYNPAQAGGPQSAGTTATPGGQQSAVGGGETAEELKDTIKQTLATVSDLPKQVLTAGNLIKRNHTDNNDSIKSTGVPAVDALLMNMGFNPA
jgi:hypothetical protein